MTDDAETRCGPRARQRQDPMLGTAFPATRTLLVEQPGGWGPAGLRASKFDADIAENLIRSLGRDGIRVIAIAPGVFMTPMMAGLPQAAQESLGASVPFPARLGQPAEYAALAIHIIENGYINGETIRIDGALRMPPK